MDNISSPMVRQLRLELHSLRISENLREKCCFFCLFFSMKWYIRNPRARRHRYSLAFLCSHCLTLTHVCFNESAIFDEPMVDKYDEVPPNASTPTSDGPFSPNLLTYFFFQWTKGQNDDFLRTGAPLHTIKGTIMTKDVDITKLHIISFINHHDHHFPQP